MTVQDIELTKQKSFKLTEEAQRLLWALCGKYGINQTAMLEVLIRRVAEQEHLNLE